MPESREVIWSPTPKQADFLRCPASELLYGGSVGGGKTDALAAGALRHVENPAHSALLLRRTIAEAEKSLVERTRVLYKAVCPTADYHDGKHRWTFPSGAKIWIGHCEHEDDVRQYQSSQFDFIGIDEATHFSRGQYTFLLSRLRSAAGLPCRMRLCSNPGGPGEAWVLERWRPWLDPDAPHPAASGEVRTFNSDGEEVPAGTLGSMSRSFVRAGLADNEHLTRADPGYLARLQQLDPYTRQQLLEGHWGALPSAGALFKRQWLRVVEPDQVPRQGLELLRWWDLAATTEAQGKDPDWTVGALLAEQDGTFWILDIRRERMRPMDVEALVRATAESDGRSVPIWIEQEPGSGGVMVVDHFARQVLTGFDFHAERSTGDKLSYAKPFSAAAERGNVRIVRARWNEKLLSELEAFPSKGVHDDQVDACSKAFAKLASGAGSLAWLSAMCGNESPGRRNWLDGPLDPLGIGCLWVPPGER